jgi:hypothetical protein
MSLGDQILSILNQVDDKPRIQITIGKGFEYAYITIIPLNAKGADIIDLLYKQLSPALGDKLNYPFYQTHNDREHTIYFEKKCTGAIEAIKKIKGIIVDDLKGHEVVIESKEEMLR